MEDVQDTYLIFGVFHQQRAYRLKWPPNVTVFEIDYPEIFEEVNSISCWL